MCSLCGEKNPKSVSCSSHPAWLSPSPAVTLSFPAPATQISELPPTGPWHGLFSLPNSFLHPHLLLFQVNLAQIFLPQKSIFGLPDEVNSPVTSFIGPCISPPQLSVQQHIYLTMSLSSKRLTASLNLPKGQPIVLNKYVECTNEWKCSATVIDFFTLIWKTNDWSQAPLCFTLLNI